MADDACRQVMIKGGAIASVVCVATALISWTIPHSRWLAWIVAGAYFILSIAHSGVRIGRKANFQQGLQGVEVFPGIQ